MSGNDIRAIDGSFLRGLAAFSSQASGQSSSVLSSSSSSATNVTLSLRVGAQTFANAIKGLNSLAGILNVAENDLGKLGEIVDKMIVLADRSSKSSVSDSTRSGLNRDFKALVNDFRALVNDSSVNDEEYLTKEGLANLFRLVGLDEASSESIAGVFEQFITPEVEDDFASEKTKGPRPVKVQGTGIPSDTTDIFFSQISHASDGITGGVVTALGSVYQDDDNLNGQNPDGVETIGFVGLDGDEQALQSKPTTDTKMLFSHDRSGYTLFVSDQDFLGYNASNYYQAFVADSDGVVISQVTKFGSATTIDQWETGGLSEVGSIVYIATNDGATTSTLTRYDSTGFGNLSPDPANFTTTDVDTQVFSGGPTFSELDVNDHGDMYAYRVTDGADNRVYFRNMNSGDADDGNISSDLNAYTDFGFVGGETIEAWNPSTFFLRAFQYGSGGIAKYNSGGLPIAHWAFAEGTDANGNNGIVAFNIDFSPALNNIIWTSGDLTAGLNTIRQLATSGDTVNALSLARTEGGFFDIGIDGTLQAFDDPERQLYRISVVPHTGVAPVIRSEEVDKIFNGNILNRPSATRTLVDLKELRKQIDDNIEAIGNARGVLGKNIELVRSAGFAFLNLSDQISGTEEADEVARRLQSAIRRDSGAAISQAENLTDIAFAALGILDNNEE